MPDLESAIYAIAIGYTADPLITRPLNWSAFDIENLAYHAFLSLFDTKKTNFVGKQNTGFDPQRPLGRFFLCWLITLWNSRSHNKINLFVVEANGSTDSLVYCEVGKPPKSIFIRLKDDRWDGCDCTVPNVESGEHAVYPARAMPKSMMSTDMIL